jgi:hypothetical protein
MKPLKEELRSLCVEIETLPASQQQTKISLMASEIYNMTAHIEHALNFLRRNTYTNSRIVSTCQLTIAEIDAARQENKMFVDTDGLGWVLIQE